MVSIARWLVLVKDLAAILIRNSNVLGAIGVVHAIDQRVEVGCRFRVAERLGTRFVESRRRSWLEELIVWLKLVLTAWVKRTSIIDE